MWQLRWKIQQLLLTFLVNTRPTCSGVQCSVGGDNYFDKLHSCYYLVLVIVNCRQHTASEEWEHSAQNATPHTITWYCVALSREMRLLEAAWGGQNEESSCWLGDKLRLCEVVRLGWCTQYELFRGDHLAQLFDIHWPRIQYLCRQYFIRCAFNIKCPDALIQILSLCCSKDLLVIQHSKVKYYFTKVM